MKIGDEGQITPDKVPPSIPLQLFLSRFICDGAVLLAGGCPARPPPASQKGVMLAYPAPAFSNGPKTWQPALGTPPPNPIPMPPRTVPSLSMNGVAILLTHQRIRRSPLGLRT